MSEPTKEELLYLLERIRFSCQGGGGVYHSGGEDDTEYPLLRRLEVDGLIERSYEEEDHIMWRLACS